MEPELAGRVMVGSAAVEQKIRNFLLCWQLKKLQKNLPGPVDFGETRSTFLQKPADQPMRPARARNFY